MKAIDKLKLIAPEMDLEIGGETEKRSSMQPPTPPVCGSTGPTADISASTEVLSRNANAKQEALGITKASMPGGKKITLLKTMITTACERNCNYCTFRAGSSCRRSTFTPDEMADTFMKMNRAGMVEGLFLSSGIIKGGVTSQDKLIDTVEILRTKHEFRGYVHLKIMPGAEEEQIRRSMQVASRVSVNLEGPNDRRLALLAPKKSFLMELVEPLKLIEKIRSTEDPTGTWNGRWPSSTTQFVVGAVGESDLELMLTSEFLFRNAGLSRVYYMAFRPVPGTPFEEIPAANPWRQHRLYQASFLLRDYGFDLEEMAFSQGGNLSLTMDPKHAWALEHLSEAPVEVNLAEQEQLLRVPGIGPKGASSIIQARRRGKFRELKDLKSVGVNPRRPAPFVLLDGRRPRYQLRLPIQ
jgi:predicted DNA-binding helix-hairpin-helix protein